MVISPVLTQFSPVQIVKVQCSPNSHQLKLLKSNAHPIFITSNGSKCNAHSILINSKYSSQTLTQFSPPTIGWCAILSQFSPDQKPTLQFSPNSHLCSQYSCNSHQLEMAGANAHLMLIYNFHQIGENWLRIGWELSESWNSFLLGECRSHFWRCVIMTPHDIAPSVNKLVDFFVLNSFSESIAPRHYTAISRLV